MKPMNHTKAVATTCCVALLWSIFGLIIKSIQWSPYAIAGGRSIIAALVLTPFVLKSKNTKINWYVIGGAVCYAAFNYCFNVSTKLATAAIAIVMQYTAPVYVSILAWIFLKERITKADIISIVFVLCGMSLFVMDSAGGGNMVGKIIAVFNGIFFAGMSIFLRLQKDGNPVMSMYLGNIISGIIGIPLIFQSGIPNTKSILLVLLAGVLCAGTYATYAVASTGLSALETVLLPIIDPVMNPVWVFLFLGEAPGFLSIIGMVVVLVSVTTRVIYGLKADQQTPPNTASV